MVGLRIMLSVALLAALLDHSTSNARGLTRSQGVNPRNLRNDIQARDQYSEFPPHYFEQPLDHFSNTSGNFRQRYWFSTRHYVPGSGGPVIVLDSGEVTGEDRLQFLDTGIVEILTAATGGVGVVLEHRYYGDSVPVTNFSTDSLRWLNNAQALADSANFMSNVKFPGIDEDLTAPKIPWIYYGGSYAGARSAHMKILYPHLVFGAIASSGVTHATIEDWQYMEVIRRAAESTCSYNIENSISTIDSILAIPRLRHSLKELFGLAGLERDADFGTVLESVIETWQDKNWNPAIGSTVFDDFCKELVKPPPGIDAAAANAPYGDPARLITLPNGLSLDFAVLNYANYINDTQVSPCPKNQTVEQCLGLDDASLQNNSISDARAWQFQVCTEWGYFVTAPPNPKYPRIVSRSLTLESQTRACKLGFPPGKYFTVPALPNITAVNALGGFSIAADRLAIIDGEIDPWRPETPHCECASKRPDTLLRPFKLIPYAVHHYDEYGLRDINDEPEAIRKIHHEMIDFLMEWLKDWKAGKGRKKD